MFRSIILGLCLAIFVALPKAGTGVERGLLWHVIQTCVVTHDVVGISFPCLDVETKHGLDTGYAVLRAPFDKSHIVVSPTVQTSGIEAERLRGANAPNYFADAWSERRFATDGLARTPSRSDFALAVNSRKGRSQDQLHIHVDCIRPRVKQALASQSGTIDTRHWTLISVLPQAPRYWVTASATADLRDVNVFDLVANGLAIAPEDMDEMTVVVVGSESAAKPGFMILARRRIPNSGDEAHGEALLDHSCTAFR